MAKAFRLNMKKVFGYAKFGIGLIVILVFYKNVIVIHGTDVIDPNDVSMIPTLNPRDRFYYRRNETKATQMKRMDLVIYRRPKKPAYWYVGRIKGVPGETIHKGQRNEQVVPRGFLWVESDNRRKRITNMIHETFIIGRLQGVRILPRDEGRI